MSGERFLIKRQIELFISRFKGAENVFLCGMCYWFAFMLQNRFQCGEIIYDATIGHFMWMYDGVAYDVTGEREVPTSYETLSDIRLSDPLLYLRLIRDCVLKADY